MFIPSSHTPPMGEVGYASAPCCLPFRSKTNKATSRWNTASLMADRKKEMMNPMLAFKVFIYVIHIQNALATEGHLAKSAVGVWEGL